MNRLWSSLFEQVTLVRQQFRDWTAQLGGGKPLEGVYPDSFLDEVPVRPRGASPTREQRRFRLLPQGTHSLLMVKHGAPDNHLYFDHVNERQLDWMGRGRRDVTGKRVPIYGTMVLRTNPERLIEIIVADEWLWDELRRIVMPQVAESEKRAVDWKRYWIHAHLSAPVTYWQTNLTDLQEIIRVLGRLAAKIEGVEEPVAEVPVDPG